MIDHLSTYTTDFEKSKNFYTAAFEPLGYSVQTELVAEWNPDWPSQRLCAFGPAGKPVYWLAETKQAASPRHIAFVANDRKSVDAFYKAGLEHGGKDNGEPGLRPMYHEHYYGSFLFDPDGNNVEAVCHKPE